MPDVTLTIGGDASGVPQATRQAEQAIQGLGAAAGAAATPVKNTGDFVRSLGMEAGFGRRELMLLATSLRQAGVEVPGLNAMLFMLMNTALTPLAVGAGTAIIAIEGLRALFGAAAASTAEERQETLALAKAYADLAEKMREVTTARGGGKTTERAVAAEVTNVRRTYGLTQDEVTAGMKFLQKRRTPLSDEEKDIFWKAMAAGPLPQFEHSQGSPEQKALREARLATGDPAIKQAAQAAFQKFQKTTAGKVRYTEAAVQMKEDDSFPVLLTRFFEKQGAVGPEEAAERTKRVLATAKEGNWGLGAGFMPGLRKRTFRRLDQARAAGFDFENQTTPSGPVANFSTVNIGTQLIVHPGQDVTDHGAPGQIRGPSE